MIVNGIDIVGYQWAKFVKSDVVKHEIDGKDIVLYGNNSRDFAHLFEVRSEVDIVDSEFIDVSPAEISRIGSIWVQSNTVDEVLLNIILTDTEASKVLVSNNSVLLVVHKDDVIRLDLGRLSEDVKILKFAKEPSAKIGNVRNFRVRKDEKVDLPYYSESIYPMNGKFMTNMNYARCLNRLNHELTKILPGFNLIVGKRDRVNQHPNTIYCEYDQMEIIHRHFFRSLRRNIMHKLPVRYEFRVADDIKYAKLQYEISNYDFITNICELTVNDDNTGTPWTFAMHWEVEPFNVDLLDPKTGEETVSRTIRCTCNIHLFTSIDNYVTDLTKFKDDIINRIELEYTTCDKKVSAFTLINYDGTFTD